MTGKELQELRIKKRLMRSQLANLIKRKQEDIYAWENEIRPINYNTEIALKAFLVDVPGKINFIVENGQRYAVSDDLRIFVKVSNSDKEGEI